MDSDSDRTISDRENAGESDEDWEPEGSEVESSEEEEEEDWEVENSEDDEDEEEVEGNDRISELPDAIIEEILSFIPMMDAIRTSILSERWRWSWASITKIEFLFSEFNDSLLNFCEFITSTMMLNRSTTIHKFVLRSYFAAFMTPAINFCLREVVLKHVEELCLDLESYDQQSSYWLPPDIYLCETIKKLSVTYCQIFPTVPVNWRSLRDLTIERAFLKDQVIQMLLAGSPQLESLLLRGCGGYNRINSDTLTRLVIDEHGNENPNTWLEINTPNLDTLELAGCMRVKLQSMRNLLSALLNVNLTFDLLEVDDEVDDMDPDTTIDNDVDEDTIYQDMVTRLLNKIRHAKYLILGTWLIQALSALELQEFPLSIIQCKHLTLDTDLSKEEFPGFNRLLRSSPNLEKLVVDLSGFHDSEEYEGGPADIWNFDANNYWESKTLLSQCLKSVEFIGFTENVPEFAKFLLQHAQGLETMIFCKSKGNNYDRKRDFGQGKDFFGIINELLNFPRSSPHANILIE